MVSPGSDPQRRRRTSPLYKLLGGCLALVLCVGCVAALTLGGTLYFARGWFAAWEMTAVPEPAGVDDPGLTQLQPSPTSAPVTTATPFPTGVPTVTSTPAPTLAALPLPDEATTPDAKPVPDRALPAEILQKPISAEQYEQLARVTALEAPAHDFYASALRLSSRDPGPRLAPAQPFAVGASRSFFVDTGQINATLIAATEHTYFWVEEGLNLDPLALTAAAERFERDYYPRVERLVGSAWEPGIDEDPRFSVLHLDTDVDETDELGYFNSGDEYPPTFYSDSNAQEIIYLNMGNLAVGEDLYFGTLVHEFQHLAQWYVDSNEATWMDEGISQLAELYAGLDTATFVDYLAAPEVQLNSWSYEEDVYAHYGSAYLFMVYLWEQLGEDAVLELARHPANGLSSVRSILAGYRPELSVEQLFANWAVANLLDSPAAGPAFNYERLELGRVRRERDIRTLPYEMIGDLNQFGVHYLDLDTSGEVTISFAGDTHTRFTPVAPHSGTQMWFVPTTDGLEANLTRAFDLRPLDSATLTFWTWYDLESDYDFAYVTISTDGGQSWDLLAPDQAGPGDYGPGFSGASWRNRASDQAGWLPAVTSLDNYVGQEVLIRFEVLTDAAVSSQGFAVDDIAIPEIGFSDDVEASTEGWQASGFVQTGQWLPQQWALQLVEPGPAPEVRILELNPANQGSWIVELGRQGGVVVVTPLTPYSTERANYWLFVEQP